jgi:hypothetical protein
MTEAVMRNDLGERYFTAWNYLVGLFFTFVAAIPVRTLFPAVHAPGHQSFWSNWGFLDYLNIVLGLIWFFAFALDGRKHLRASRQRHIDGVLWHSYSIGIPSTGLKWSPAHQALVPIIVGIVLLVLQCYSVGALLIVSGYISMQSRLIEAAIFYNRVLDVIDAQLEQENLSDAVLKKRAPDETCGFETPVPAYVSRQHRDKFLKGMGAKQAQPVEAARAQLSAST